MSPELEKKIFGYVDPYPPIKDSVKERMIKIIDDYDKQFGLSEWMIDDLAKRQRTDFLELHKIIMK